MRFSRAIVAAVALLASAAPSQLAGQTLFFNGNGGTDVNLTSEQIPSLSFASVVLENYTVTGAGATVTGLFGQYFVTSGQDWSTAFWQIRTGVSAGVAGAVVASGTSSATQVALGGSIFEAAVSGLSVFLAPGEYWFGLSPIHDFSGGGQVFLAAVNGTGGVNPNLDQTTYFDAGGFFSENVSLNYQGPYDFALGVNGRAAPAGDVVPEPATMTLLATGLLGLGASRRRRAAS